MTSPASYPTWGFDRSGGRGFRSSAQPRHKTQRPNARNAAKFEPGVILPESPGFPRVNARETPQMPASGDGPGAARAVAWLLDQRHLGDLEHPTFKAAVRRIAARSPPPSDSGRSASAVGTALHAPKPTLNRHGSNRSCPEEVIRKSGI
jgi:hypothetical protein